MIFAFNYFTNFLDFIVERCYFSIYCITYLYIQTNAANFTRVTNEIAFNIYFFIFFISIIPALYETRNAEITYQCALINNIILFFILFCFNLISQN